MTTILITGASGGLAQEMVKLLPNDQLILLGRNKEKLAQLIWKIILMWKLIENRY